MRCFPDATGYALSSVEGRIAMEYFDLSEGVQVGGTSLSPFSRGSASLQAVGTARRADARACKPGTLNGGGRLQCMSHGLDGCGPRHLWDHYHKDADRRLSV